MISNFATKVKIILAFLTQIAKIANGRAIPASCVHVKIVFLEFSLENNVNTVLKYKIKLFMCIYKYIK